MANWTMQSVFILYFLACPRYLCKLLRSIVCPDITVFNYSIHFVLKYTCNVFFCTDQPLRHSRVSCMRVFAVLYWLSRGRRQDIFEYVWQFGMPFIYLKEYLLVWLWNAIARAAHNMTIREPWSVGRVAGQVYVCKLRPAENCKFSKVCGARNGFRI